MKQTLPEALASEIKRVTEIKAQYERMRGMPQINVEPAIRMMEHELKQAIEASGSGDIEHMALCLIALRDYEQ